MASILVVTDEPFERIAYQAILSPPHWLAIASNSAEALAILRSELAIDFLVCDHRLAAGDMDGIDLIRQASEIRPNLFSLLTTSETPRKLQPQLDALAGQGVKAEYYNKNQGVKGVRVIVEYMAEYLPEYHKI